MDPSRRHFLAMTLYAAALPIPAYLDVAGRTEYHASGRATRIGAGEVATVRTMTERVADILDELGGGHARPMVTYGRTLRGMALQAANLKHAKRAQELADSAAEAVPKAGPQLRAFLAGQQAQGAALVGAKHQAFSRLAETEAALAEADNRRDCIGGYDRAAYHFHVSSVLYALGDVPGSVKAMKDSNRMRPPVERQGRAHANGLLAQRQLEVGHLEASCVTWGEFLDDYAHLSSARADEHFGVLRQRMRPYLKNPRARELYNRASDLERQKAA